MNEKILNASEALYGFAGWITSRKEAVTAGSTHECGVWAELVDKFIKTNDLPEVRDDVWTKYLTHPKSEK